MKQAQALQAEINRVCGFEATLPALALGAAAETGELADYIAKLSGLKKPKPGDDLSDLQHKIAAECADVLVYLLQIANALEFDLEAAHQSKCEKLRARHVDGLVVA